MAIVFKTKQDALKFLRGLDNYFEHTRGEVFSPSGRYYLSHGEYESPDYKPVRYKDGWGIKGVYYYCPGTFHAPKDGRCDVVDITTVWDDVPVYRIAPMEPEYYWSNGRVR